MEFDQDEAVEAVTKSVYDMTREGRGESTLPAWEDLSDFTKFTLKESYMPVIVHTLEWVAHNGPVKKLENFLLLEQLAQHDYHAEITAGTVVNILAGREAEEDPQNA